jgi:putative ABC transport system permease protein
VGRDLNKDVHLPLTTAELEFGDVVYRRSSGSFSGEEVEVSEIYITAPSTEAVLAMADRVEQIVQVDHAAMNDVQLIVPWELLEQAKRTTMVMNVMLISIAAISLLVGGIGIMNIMLASVTERTREIGIRRALGATRKNITLQFLVETGSLSAMGGLLGIALGLGLAFAVERGLPWLLNETALRRYFDSAIQVETQVTTWSIVASFVVAAAVGLVFGIYPALGGQPAGSDRRPPARLIDAEPRPPADASESAGPPATSLAMIGRGVIGHRCPPGSVRAAR